MDVGVRERGGVKGKCKVFGLSDRESLEFIPEAVGSHRKMLSLGGGRGEGTGSDAIITKEAARTGNTGLGDRPRGWILALAQPPTHCGLLGRIKLFSGPPFLQPTKSLVGIKAP